MNTILQGKTCLVTGAGGGIGRALALELATRNTRLVLASRTPARLEETASAARAAGAADVVTFSADIASDAGLADLLSCVAQFPVDVLINNAGVFPNGSIADATVAELDACLAVNLRAPFVLTKAVAGRMSARGWGRIVNIGSSSAYAGAAKTAIYCASKHALLGLSRALHVELRDSGVRVHCVSPGSVKTDMGRDVAGQEFETFIEPQEVAQTILFLLEQDGNLVIDEARLNRMVYR